jgi:hypothetical protein
MGGCARPPFGVCTGAASHAAHWCPRRRLQPYLDGRRAVRRRRRAASAHVHVHVLVCGAVALGRTQEVERIGPREERAHDGVERLEALGVLLRRAARCREAQVLADALACARRPRGQCVQGARSTPRAGGWSVRCDHRCELRRGAAHRRCSPAPRPRPPATHPPLSSSVRAERPAPAAPTLRARPSHRRRRGGSTPPRRRGGSHPPRRRPPPPTAAHAPRRNARRRRKARRRPSMCAHLCRGVPPTPPSTPPDAPPPRAAPRAAPRAEGRRAPWPPSPRARRRSSS